MNNFITIYSTTKIKWTNSFSKGQNTKRNRSKKKKIRYFEQPYTNREIELGKILPKKKTPRPDGFTRRNNTNSTRLLPENSFHEANITLILWYQNK